MQNSSEVIPEILVFAGSTRKASLNKYLLKNAVPFIEEAGGRVTLIDLRDYSMPLYDEDLEADSGIPSKAMEIRKLMEAHHGVMIACPEYNNSIPGVLKNMIDWVSRPLPGEPPLVAFRNKTAALLAATPGKMGGLLVLSSIRAILGSLGMIVIPKQYGLGNAKSSFDEDGRLTNEIAQKHVTDVAQQLVEVTKRLIQTDLL